MLNYNNLINSILTPKTRREKMGKKKILVIDDNKIFRKLIAEIITIDFHNKYKVVTAPNGQEGLKLFKKENPDLVISDFIMPGWNGYETANKIKEISPTTPVIIATGYMNIKEERPNNVVSIIPKPFSIKRLWTAIEVAIGKP